MTDQPQRVKPWPFVGGSLFLCDPAHDNEDRAVFDHVLKQLRKDFQISDDEKDPRIQILLDDAVNTFVKLAVYRSKALRNGHSEDSKDNTERRLRNEIRIALTAIMNFTNPKKSERKITLEKILSGIADE